MFCLKKRIFRSLSFEPYGIQFPSTVLSKWVYASCNLKAPLLVGTIVAFCTPPSNHGSGAKNWKYWGPLSLCLTKQSVRCVFSNSWPDHHHQQLWPLAWLLPLVSLLLAHCHNVFVLTKIIMVFFSSAHNVSLRNKAAEKCADESVDN